MPPTRLSSDLERLEYGTYLGSGVRWVEHIPASDYAKGLAIEPHGTVWIGGFTYSPGFPVTANAYQGVNHGSDDAFLARFDLPFVSSVGPQRIPLPEAISLEVYPNPFNPTTTLSFTLSRPASPSLRVFNIAGQLVREESLGRLTAGAHEVRFDASDLASGIYFARLETGDEAVVRKMVVMK